jgi:hypothetical protein
MFSCGSGSSVKAVVGSVLLKQVAPNFKDAALFAGFLWDPKGECYAAVAVAKKVLDRKPIDSSLDASSTSPMSIRRRSRSISIRSRPSALTTRRAS